LTQMTQTVLPTMQKPLHQSGNHDSRPSIAFLLPSLGLGGAERQLLTLLENMDSTRFRCTLLVLQSRPNDLAEDFARLQGLEIHNLGKKHSFDPRFILRLNRFLAHESFDILYAINACARLFGYLIGRWQGVRQIVFAERNSEAVYSSMGSRVYHWIESRIFPHVDHVVTNSPSGFEFCQKRGVSDNKIQVIENGIELGLPTHSPSNRNEKRPLVGMVARFTRQKDHETFLFAAQKVLAVRPDVRFVLLGDGPCLARMQSLAHRLHLAEAVTFAGQQPKVIDYLNQMDLAVLTSRQAEGCPNSVIEAMSLGIPVIATNVSGTRDWIEHEKTGFLVPPGNPAALADCLLARLADLPAARQVGANAAEFASHTFSKQRMANRFEDLFSRLSPFPLATIAKGRTTDGHAWQKIQAVPTSDLFGFPVAKITLDQCVQLFDRCIPNIKPVHIVLVNAAKIVKAHWDRELALIIRHADLIGADGIPIVWLSRLLGRPLPGRLNGTDLMFQLFALAEEKQHRIYLLGAREPVIESAVAELRQRYPNLPLAGYHSGYFASPEELEMTLAEIAASKADILLIGMGSPMKEKWVRKYKARLRVSVIHGVGGSFDILGGLTRRAPHWMQRAGLEWFFRLIQEPQRMWKRYLLLNSFFLFFSCCEIVRTGMRQIGKYFGYRRSVS